MPKKIEEKLHILSPYRGYLASANIMGPIVHPLVVEKSVVAKILMSGADVYEYLPHNKKTLKLTLTNINDPNRYDELNEKVVDVAPVTVAPVMRTGVPVISKTEETEPDNAAAVEETATVNELAANNAVEEPDVTEPTTATETEPGTAIAVEETSAEDESAANNAVEEPDVTEPTTATETQQPAFAIEFEYNEDGTVNEDKIEWSAYSKNQRKEIRAQINQHNASLNK